MTHSIASTVEQQQQFTVVIPAWNESQYIEATLNAVKKAIGQQQERGEIVVVDNNSTDNTASLATNNGARVVFEQINHLSMLTASLLLSYSLRRYMPFQAVR